jgi:predicted transporter
MHRWQIFLHIFDKPTQRSPLNAGLCYLLIFVLFAAFIAVLRMAMPPGDEPNAALLIIAVFTMAPLMNFLSQQAKEWWCPKARRHDDRHWR